MPMYSFLLCRVSLPPPHPIYLDEFCSSDFSNKSVKYAWLKASPLPNRVKCNVDILRNHTGWIMYIDAS